ncbi:MAG: hypothetical protein IKQ46_00565 [Bacteroidales bacterium]|nr:hypothetical protein [Bacteroidales bacterium]
MINSRIFKLILLLFSFILIVFSLLFGPKHEIKPSSNEEIITAYSNLLNETNIFGDSLFLNQIAEAFIETNYEGVIMYNCHFSGGGLHTFGDYNTSVDLTDSFPKIRDVIKTKFPNAKDSYFDYYYNNGIVIIISTYPYYNHMLEPILLLYTNHFEVLKQRFSKYKFYNTNVAPQELYGWIYRINKKWYICSPYEDIYIQKI